MEHEHVRKYRSAHKHKKFLILLDLKILDPLHWTFWVQREARRGKLVSYLYHILTGTKNLISIYFRKLKAIEYFGCYVEVVLIFQNHGKIPGPPVKP